MARKSVIYIRMGKSILVFFAGSSDFSGNYE
nr:MAG TPA: hypothetical protein [Caudoviricetes sp.]